MVGVRTGVNSGDSDDMGGHNDVGDNHAQSAWCATQWLLTGRRWYGSGFG